MKCNKVLAPSHILVGTKEKILKGIRKNRHITYKGLKCGMTSDFFQKIMEEINRYDDTIKEKILVNL